MLNINEVNLVGNVGRDPETRTFQNGGRKVSFSIATTKRWKDRNGEMKEATQWHRVSVMNENLAAVAERLVKKGTPVLVRGELESSDYKDKDGIDRTITEIVLRSPDSKLIVFGRDDSSREASRGDAPAERSQAREASPQRASAAKSGNSWDAMDTEGDEIPF